MREGESEGCGLLSVSTLARHSGASKASCGGAPKVASYRAMLYPFGHSFQAAAPMEWPGMVEVRFADVPEDGIGGSDS